MVGGDQQKQEGQTVTTRRISGSRGFVLHKASREITIFTIRFSHLKQTHLLSAAPAPLIRTAPVFCEAGDRC